MEYNSGSNRASDFKIGRLRSARPFEIMSTITVLCKSNANKICPSLSFVYANFSQKGVEFSEDVS